MKRLLARASTVVGAAALVAGSAIAGPAIADDVTNNLDNSIDATVEVINLAAGGAVGTVGISIQPRNGDGVNGCNVKQDGTLVVAVSSSAPAVATVAPSSLTFATCGSQSVSVTPLAAGATTISLSVLSNNSGGSFNLAPATFSVNVTASTPPNTAPVLSVPASPYVVEAASPAGSVVSYTATASDAEDNPDPTPLCSPASGTVFPIGSTLVSCTVTDSGGRSDTETFTVVVADSTRPTVDIETTAVPGPTGWFNVDSSGTGGIVATVTASDAVGVDEVTCTDNGAASALDLGSPVTLGDGVHDLACTATDAAGNIGSDAEEFQVDQTAPTMTADLSPAPNGEGWNNTDVLVSYTCADATSGLDPAHGSNIPSDGCWAPDSVVSDGLTTFHRAVVDVAGNAASYEFSVRRDTVDPTISGSATPPANANGWNRTDVTVAFQCLDSLSTVASCTAASTLDTEGAGQSVTGTATDKAGNDSSTTVGPVNIDRTDPTIGFTRTPANAAGWNNGPVTVSFTCEDGLSGVDALTDPVTVSTEGAGQSVTGTCTDLAGNSSSVTVEDIDIDLTAPSITSGRTPAANANGWNNGDVTVFFTCTDGGPSGIATDTVAGATVSAEGEDQSVTSTGDCVDAAGNTALPATVGGIDIDRTNPVVTGSASPAPNAAGWNNTAVEVTFSCADTGAVQSGIDSDTVAGATLSSDGEDQSVTSTGVCVDAAGNAALPATVGGIDIDMTAPGVAVSVTPSPVVLGGPVAVDATATDGLSGVVGGASCGPVSSAAVGAQTVTCTAVDAAGNTGSGTATYSVVYAWSGFFQPIDNTPAGGAIVFNKAKAGQSIPAKFSLGGDQGLDIVAAGYPKVTSVACTATAEDLIETYAATTANNGLVYDRAANQYNYVWKTQSTWANSCRKFDLMLVDGTHHVAYFKFVK